MNDNAATRVWLRAGALALGAGLLLAGCSRGGSTGGRKRYPLMGQVVAVDRAKDTVTVAAGNIPGLMPAMTMDYAVNPGDAASLRPGEPIRAELVIDRPGAEPTLDRIWPNDPAARAAIAAAANALSQDTHNRGEQAYRAVGEAMPEFALYDQNGRVVQSDRFRGKQIMMDFIYTRCPLANMCPLSTAKMIEAQKLARKDGVKNLELVSITLDPTYDTPGVLKAYAQARNIDTSNFSFLTGPQGAVEDLLNQFGVFEVFTGGILKHTLTTLLIDAKGKIIWRADGSGWEPKDFVERMHRA
ncbi:MAG: SCO family protein [Opitutaceae bacterium]